MIEILLASFISVCQFLFFGKFFNKFIFKNSYKTLSYTKKFNFWCDMDRFYRFNNKFFLPINIFVGNLFLISSIILF